MIEIANQPATYTLGHPAIVTVYLINQLPGREALGGVTLYFEPLGIPLITLVLTNNNIDCSYEDTVAQGIRQALDQLNVDITGLRIWWCDWLWHPVDSRSRLFKDAAKKAVIEAMPWLSSKNFLEDPKAITPIATPPFSSNIFEQKPLAYSHMLENLQSSGRWTLKTPLISHITQISTQPTAKVRRLKHLRLSQTMTQTTLSFKSIAPSHRVCPVDKLPVFQAGNGEIFNIFAKHIHRDLPNARGFDIMIQQLTYQTNHQNPRARKADCLRSLTYALQQAVNVGQQS